MIGFSSAGTVFQTLTLSTAGCFAFLRFNVVPSYRRNHRVAIRPSLFQISPNHDRPQRQSKPIIVTMAKASSTLFAVSCSASARLSLLRRSESLKPSVLSARFSVPMAMAASAATAIKLAPAVIVGGGRVGRALQEMGNGEDLLVKRGEAVPVDFEGPILVCTRNDDLDAVLEATPQSRWKDLVFFQNGMMEPWFESKGLGDTDQVLAYFAVSKLGEPPVDGKTDTNPEGLTAAYGKWAAEVAARLQSGGLSCKVLDKEAFQKQMLEKLIWICAFMLVGARHPGASVGMVEKEHRDEVSRLIQELAAAAAAEKGLTFEENMVARLCAYTRAVSHFPTAVKEFKWRNGWFYSLSEKAVAEGKPDPCPLHTEWLKELKVI